MYVTKVYHSKFNIQVNYDGKFKKIEISSVNEVLAVFMTKPITSCMVVRKLKETICVGDKKFYMLEKLLSWRTLSKQQKLCFKNLQG